MPRIPSAWQAENRLIIAEFRANGGRLTRLNPVILLTTTGAKTGRERVAPLNFSTDGDRIVVIASTGGGVANPSWYVNLVANPVVTIEHEGETFRARASTAGEPERTRLFDRQAAAMPFFDTYRRRVKSREIPVVVFERIRD